MILIQQVRKFQGRKIKAHTSILQRIRLKYSKFENTYFFHVKFHINTNVDVMENKGVTFEQGILVIDNTNGILNPLPWKTIAIMWRRKICFLLNIENWVIKCWLEKWICTSILLQFLILNSFSLPLELRRKMSTWLVHLWACNIWDRWITLKVYNKFERMGRVIKYNLKVIRECLRYNKF